MVNNNLKKSAGSFGRKNENHQADAVKKRRFRRARSAPARKLMLEEPVHSIDAEKSESLLKSTLRPSIRKVAACLLLYLGVGVICFYFLRHQLSGKKTNAFIDSLYFCVSTMTASGYGDLVPQTDLLKLLVCAFVFSGMAVVALILSKAADYLVEKQEALLERALHLSKEIGPTDIMKAIESKKAKYKCIMAFVSLFILLMIGTLFLTFVEKLHYVEAFYCVCAITTTLGYGYPSFSSLGGRIFAIVWIMMSTICLAQCFLYLTEFNAEKRQRYLVEHVLSRQMSRYDLEAADLDDDGVVDAAEFALYKLKEMGKITEEDLALVMKEFEELDVDQSGTISAADLTLAQSTPRAKDPISDV